MMELKKLSIYEISAYEESACILYLCKSIYEVEKGDIEPVELNTVNLTRDFWLALGDKIATKLNRLNFKPRWYLFMSEH